MAGSKATRHPTKTDTLIRTVDQARQARGLNRHRIIPRVSQLPTGGGGQAAIGGFGASGNFLDPTGDTMIGPIAFSPEFTAIDNTDPTNPSIDIGINSGFYSTYLQVTGSDDELRTIFGASFNGQLLYLQYTGVGELTIKQGDGTDGGNIVTNTGGDLIVNFGEVVIFLFDPGGGADPGVNGAWRVVAAGIGGGTGGDAKTGSMSATIDNTQSVATATQVTLDVFDIVGIEDGVTVNTTTNILTIQEAGRYLFGTNINVFTDTNNTNVAFQIFINGIGLPDANSLFIRGTADSDSLYPTAPLDLNVDDEVEIRISHEEGGTVLFTFEECTFYLTKLGGSSGTGGGATSLDQLTDVDFPVALINDQVLTFNGTTSLWENKPFPSGGMNTDLSNMSSPTVPQVELDMAGQDIRGINTLEFISTGTKSITTLDNIFFNQSQQSIISSANGINVKVNSDQEIIFETPSGIIAKFDEVNSTDRRLEMQGNRINDIGRLSLSPVFNPTTSNTSQIWEETSFNNIKYHSKNGHIFTSTTTSEVYLTITNIIGGGGFLQDIGLMNFNANEFNPVFQDGDIALVFQSGTSGPADFFVGTGGGIRNLSDIGTGGGGNEISQGNTSITIIDTGSGSITDIVDGTTVSTKSASIFTINQPVAFTGNTLSGLGDTTPATNHFFRLGDFTLFWDQVFTDKIALQNANNTLIGSSFGITHNVPTSAIHEFEVNSVPKLTIRSDEIDVEGNNIVSVGDMIMDATSDIIMAGGDIDGWDDMTAQGSTSVLDMSGGDIIDWRLLTAGSGATLNMNVGDIQGVRDLIMQASVGLIDVNGGTLTAVNRITMASGGDIVFSGSSAQITGVEDITFSGGSSSFLDLNFGDAINIDRCEINGEFNHKGSTAGFYGNNPLTRRTVDFQGTSNTQLGNTLALLLQALGDSSQGIGLINTNV